MKILFITFTILTSLSASAKNYHGTPGYSNFSDYYSRAPLDRSVYEDRADRREVRRYKQSATCSDFKRGIVAKVFNLESVRCTIHAGSVIAMIRHLEKTGFWEVIKVVNNREIFFTRTR